MLTKVKYILPFILLTYSVGLKGQHTINNFLKPSESFSKKKYLMATGFSAISYSAFSVGLYKAWYNKNQLSRFHTFNDWREWKSMDKFGHTYSAYLQTALVFQGAQWIGMNRTNSQWYAVGLSCLFQSTIEIFDGFNEGWGFSWSDIGANIVGSSIFITQDVLWKEQKFILKFSSHKIKYDQTNLDLNKRIHNLYSENILQRLLKDYNGQSYWLSFNPVSSFTEMKTFWPSYLNLAVGYGANGLFGGKSNTWFDSDSRHIQLSSVDYPRYNQYFLSFDINLQKLPVKSPLLKSIFSVINIFKIPAPALEINSLHQVKFHYLLF
ncbi:MAG: DUF2279 domain-containing protein [Saprospiraceae bacterium]